MKYQSRSILCGLLLSGLILLSGCTSFATLHSARPAEDEETRITLASGVLASPETSDGAEAAAVPTIAMVQVRNGITENLDVGLRVYMFGLMGDLNWMVYDSPWFALSLNPAVSGMSIIWDENREAPEEFTEWGALWFTVLMDIGKRRSVNMTLGPRIGYLFLHSEDGSGDRNPTTTGMRTTAPGAVLRMEVPLTDTFSLAPEGSVYFMNGTDLLLDATFSVTFIR